ncbi:MAG: phospholipid carrier-dependent glycosyltransferase [Candidatus Latescibacteria bacterium]|jgi:4-amino-4-deoxy-L-arabinose transferase-like glycosyltransferase|nr:phospholipid carrier-dependent glycosyltransferase [Candidatus Latescibacterota bacterium]
MRDVPLRLLVISVLVGLLAAIIRFGIAWSTGFDGLIGQDAYYYYEQGREMALSFDHRGQDSIGLPALVALVTLSFGMTPELAQVVGLTMGSLTPTLVVLLAWALTRKMSVATIAGLIVCLTPYHIRSSIVTMSDVPALFWVTSAMLCGVCYARRPRLFWMLSSVLLLTFATMTRYVSCLALLPVTAYAVVADFRVPRLHVAGACVIGVIVAWPEIEHMRTNIPSLFIAMSWNPVNAIRSEFTTPDGLLSYPWPVLLMDLRTLGGWGFLNPVWAGLAVIGLWKLRGDKATLAFVIFWMAGLLAFLAGLPLVNPRYLMPLVVPLSICAAVGLISVIEMAGPKTAALRIGWSVFILMGLSGFAYGTVRTVGEVLKRKDCELQVVKWINANIPAPSTTIIAFDVAHAARHYTYHRITHLHEFEIGETDLPQSPEAGVYLIWNEAHAGRIARRTPGSDDTIPRFTENYKWLQDNVSKTALAQICGWDIFRLNQ